MRLLRDLIGAHPKPSKAPGGIDVKSPSELPAQASIPLVENKPKLDVDANEAARKKTHEAPGTIAVNKGGGTALALRAAASKTGADLKRSVTIDQLTRGAPFDGIPKSDIKAVLGHKITREGLTKMYAACLPGTTPVLTACSCNGQDNMSYIVSWFDRAGNEVARAGRDINKHQDGSLELHQHTVWVSPEVRGRGVSAKAIVQEMEMLRGLSTHPKSHIALRAGEMYDVASKTRANERVGSYAWAQFGFDFADEHGLGVFKQYGARVPEEDGAGGAKLKSLSTRELVKKRFMEFVDAQMKRGALPDDANIRQALQEAASAFEHPWEIASFHVDGLTVDGKHLGKAFLTSDHSVSWDGAIFPNQKQKALAITDAYCAVSLEKSAASEDQSRAKWMAGLGSSDAAVVKHVLDEIGRFGDASWQPMLTRVKQRLPSLSADVDLAEKRIAGQTDAASVQKKRGMDPELTVAARATALEASMELAGTGTDWTLLTNLIRDPKVPKGVAESAFEVLVRREGISDKTLAVFAKSQNVAETLDRMSEEVLSALWRFTRREDFLGAHVRDASSRKWDERERVGTRTAGRDS
jgi:hypothetical protein